ncbi:hypothetical protein, partial [Yersinia sp. 2542 StPb PI]|uniref:hypothetical protein n=1 Tax=Yersinia sp. 2542 StPb PI TaxID=3117408 RepID=UPI003B2845DA
LSGNYLTQKILGFRAPQPKKEVSYKLTGNWAGSGGIRRYVQTIKNAANGSVLQFRLVSRTTGIKIS